MKTQILKTRHPFVFTNEPSEQLGHLCHKTDTPKPNVLCQVIEAFVKHLSENELDQRYSLSLSLNRHSHDITLVLSKNCPHDLSFLMQNHSLAIA